MSRILYLSFHIDIWEVSEMSIFDGLKKFFFFGLN
jgi:hypothetical protein